MTNFGFETPPPDLSNPSPSPESWLSSKRLADSQNGTTFSTTSATWRLHDDLYDLTPFIEQHPGGSDWLILSRGTDITELFETHHPNIEKARLLLKKYCLKPTSELPLPPRNSGTFSFHPDGFYASLRARAWSEVLQHSGTGPTSGMLCLHSVLLLSFLGMLLAAPYMATLSSTASSSTSLGALLNVIRTPWFMASAWAGIILALLMMCSHNFFHQQDNWRMYVFDLSPFSSYDWRITHAYSHHTFPNTSYDYEASTTANILNFYPYEFPSLKMKTSDKNGIVVTAIKRLLQFLLLQVVFLVAMNLAFSRRAYLIATGGSTFRAESLLPLALYCALVLSHVLSLRASFSEEEMDLECSAGDECPLEGGGGSRFDISEALLLPLYTLVCCYSLASWTFMTVSLATGHHHPDCWHDGDHFDIPEKKVKKLTVAGGKSNGEPPKSPAEPHPSVDWGLFQFATVGDRPGIDVSMVVASVSFGRHTLHHLFPTVDHSKLDLLVPVLKKTCREFDVRFFTSSAQAAAEGKIGDREAPTETTRTFSAFDGWIGMWKQLWRDIPSTRNYVSWKS